MIEIFAKHYLQMIESSGLYVGIAFFMMYIGSLGMKYGRHLGFRGVIFDLEISYLKTFNRISTLFSNTQLDFLYSSKNFT